MKSKITKYIITIIFCLMYLQTSFASEDNWTPVSGKRYIMAVIGNITLSGSNQNWSAIDDIYLAAFGEDNTCRGIGIIGDSSAGLNNDEFYLDIVSDKNGEMISFKLWDKKNNKIYSIEKQIDFLDGGKDEYFQLQLDALSDQVEDTEKPVISLIGDKNIILNIYDNYSDAGANASDNIDGDISNLISVEGENIDTSIAGTYTVTYNVSDNAGNIADEVIRIVTVVQQSCDSLPWKPVSGMRYTMAIIGTILENSVQVNWNNLTKVYIAAFGPDNTCRGLSIIGDSNSQLNPGEFYVDIASNSSMDEEISFKIWNCSQNSVCDLKDKISFVDGGKIEYFSLEFETSHCNCTPEIELVGEDTITIEVCSQFSDPGAKASDITDGNISQNIQKDSNLDTSTPGNYSIKYYVSNSCGGIASITRNIIVKDTKKPLLSLLGDELININIGDNYTESGAQAIDQPCKNDISDKIIINGTLDNKTSGVYKITYNVSDDFGNSADEIIRTVNVLSPEISSDFLVHNFGIIHGSISEKQKIKITNNGDADLIIQSVTMSGSHAEHFKISQNQCLQTISPSEACFITVYYENNNSCDESLESFGDIEISSNDPSLPVLNVSLRATKGNHFKHPNQESTWMDLNGQIFKCLETIDQGDEVAAFVDDGNGNLMIVGHILYGNNGYFGPLHVYGDDIETDNIKEGASQDDKIILKSWSRSECTEYTLINSSEDIIWVSRGAKESIWKQAQKQSIPLVAGWNFISFGINKCFYTDSIPEVPMISGIEYEKVDSINDILSSLDGQYSYVRGMDASGGKSYNKSIWSNMKYMAAAYGYWIKINDYASFDNNNFIYLELEGTCVDCNTSIPLNKGWNMTGYLGNSVYYIEEEPDVNFTKLNKSGLRLKYQVLNQISSNNISDVFSSIQDKYSYVRAFDSSGAKSFNPDKIEFSDLKYVGPGFGYEIKITEDTESTNLNWCGQ